MTFCLYDRWCNKIRTNKKGSFAFANANNKKYGGGGGAGGGGLGQGLFVISLIV